METAAAIERRFDVEDPREKKAMSLIKESQQAGADFGAEVSGMTVEKVLGNFQDSMKVLCASLQNQDPTNPMDMNQMSQQFATLAQTRAVIDVRDLLQKMAGSSDMSKMMDAAKQLDSLAKIKGDTFTYSPHEQVELGFYAPADAVKASYIITDEHNQVVSLFDGDLDHSPDGYHGIVWDGKDNSDNQVKPGKYKFRVSLLDKKGEILRDQGGQPLIAKTTIMGRVHGSDMKGGKPRFLIAGEHYDLDGLVSIQSANYLKEKLSLAQKLAQETQQEVPQKPEDRNMDLSAVVKKEMAQDLMKQGQDFIL